MLLELLHLPVEPLELLLHARLPLERLAREVLAAAGERLPCLRLELDDALLERVCCIWSRFFAVTTSAIPRLTFWRSVSCCS